MCGYLCLDMHYVFFRMLQKNLPGTMLTGTRSNTGCWTCRARRKKCDERKQYCSTCESLRLVCHGYGQRPDWMDGGVKERTQARAFKSDVERSKSLRRQLEQSRRYIEDLTQSVMPIDLCYSSQSYGLYTD